MDDDRFPLHKFSPTVPVTLNRLRQARKLGSSDGIICYYGVCHDIYNDYETMMAVLWNPTIRKSVGIVIPNVKDMTYGCVVIGFGVCPNTSDSKLVKIITHIHKSVTKLVNCVSWEVEVFTLSSGDCRSLSIEIPFKPVRLLLGHVFINGVIYFHGFDAIDFGHENRHNRIISFDLKSEEFGEAFLPDSLAHSTEYLSVL
ncbi:uncharacterized protein [Rutidosis leptorrhynchoides]|uniref:uncharacterized protein n=1 Tax=Rutidosis leptorrhynchoides TaxID=125765 RepID=UPI003A9A4EF3